MIRKKDLIVVCGPTASGKTALGVQIALNLNGEIISADSRQVYKGMDIGTGKDLFEYKTSQGDVPFHLIDISYPMDIYTLYHYIKDFFAAFHQIQNRNRVPVLVGGTGLYIEAVLKGYNIPNIPENTQLRAELIDEEKNVLAKKLLELSPGIYEKTDLSSKKRIIRGIEVALSADKISFESTSSRIDPLVLCTRWDRDKLKKRIEIRLKERLKQGMVEEVKNLLSSGIPAERFALFGMEYKHAARYINGEVNYATMVNDLLHSIYQLSKRQQTWFRGMEKRGIKIFWIDESNLQDALNAIDKNYLVTR